MDFALLQGMTRTGPPLARLPLLGFVAPTAYRVTDSDLRRAYLTRLCSASTLSQRLDASLRPKPSRFCFTPVTLMGFALQRLPLLTSRSRLSTPLPLLALWSATASLHAATGTRRSRKHRSNKTGAQARTATRCSLRSRVTPKRNTRNGARNRRLERAFRGLNLNRSPFVRSAVVSRTTGADPLLGFQPSRVFPLPAMARPSPSLLPCASPAACADGKPPLQASKGHFGVSMSRKIGWTL
jgi:hypothetical protein